MQRNNKQGIFETSEPRIIQVINWAFANPGKIAAIGISFMAFGVAATVLSRGEEKTEESLEHGKVIDQRIATITTRERESEEC